MVGDICLDKDGVRGAAVFAEMAIHLFDQGLSVNQQLELLYQRYVSVHKYSQVDMDILLRTTGISFAMIPK